MATRKKATKKRATKKKATTKRRPPNPLTCGLAVQKGARVQSGYAYDVVLSAGNRAITVGTLIAPTEAKARAEASKYLRRCLA